MIKFYLGLYACLRNRHVTILIHYLFGATFLVSCSGQYYDPQKIVDKTISIYGGEKYLHSIIEFDFRDRHYIIKREGGIFSKERIYKDSIHDFLTNSSFIRKIKGQAVLVPDSMAGKYTNSINSVFYFALLPYGLNDPSVNKKFLGTTTLDGQPYYKIEITFGEGAGEGHRDTFYHWIHQKSFTLDYMAYFYEEDEIWDIRFRKAMNQRNVNGIVFQDYINYKPKTAGSKFEDIETFFTSGHLEELSRIELKNISVQ